MNAIAIVTEQKLLGMETTMAKYERCGSIILHLENDLPGDIRTKIVKSIGDIRHTLLQFSFEYGLEGDQKNLRKELNIESSFLWEDLASAADSGFTGYGNLDRNTLVEVMSYLNSLIKDVKLIMKLTE